ncbi:hypothetical protein ABVK25_003691 [Lepraria finkii]|uniref:BZIP transcription factor n=1 Tax=Lepraria finkii TaxID=1340010 RepID=A0ABR4BDY1_9LECA
MESGPDPRHYPTSNHIPSLPPSTNAQANKKRRSSNTGPTPGSRGVANLTPEQLAKKRANDREAQRAIRERTKGQIETLEKKIQELTSQQPYQELQHAVRQKELVEAENKEIKKRLASALSILQPIVGGNGIIDPNQPSGREAALPHPILISGINRGPGTPNYSGPLSTASTPSAFAASPQARHTIPQAMSRLQPNAVSPVNALEQQSSQHSLQSRTPDEKLDLGYLLQNRQDPRNNGREQYPNDRTPSLPAHSPLPMHTLSPFQNARDGFGNATVAFSVPVRNIRPTCPLDGLLLDFLAERRQQAEKGASTKELIGPAYPSVISLLQPKRSHLSHPLSKVFTDMLGTFPDLSTLPEQVAVLYIMFLIMRWQISPTQETYDRLPDWVTPRPSQIFTPHPAWIDHLPGPECETK